MRVKKFCAALVLILLVNSIIAYAVDNSIEQDKKKLEATNDKMELLEVELNKKNQECNEISSQIKALDSKIDKADKELQQIQNQIDTLNSKIETTKAELGKAEENIEDKKKTLNSRLRVIYKNGNVGYLEVLLESEDISDFFTRLDMVQNIIDYDVDLLKYMKEQREIIKNKKLTLESHQTILQSSKQELKSKYEKLQVACRKKETMMQKLRADKKEMEAQYDALNKLAKDIEKEIRRKQIAADYAGGEMAWPAPGYYRITSPFGYRIHPIFKTKKMHTGIDIGAPTGATIVAVNDGVVSLAGWLGGYGNVVVLDHGGGITTLYAHNSRLLVKAGQKVKRGQAISRAGSTGYSTGAHLHFEVRKNGEYTNPLVGVKNR